MPQAFMSAFLRDAATSRDDAVFDSVADVMYTPSSDITRPASAKGLAAVALPTDAPARIPALFTLPNFAARHGSFLTLSSLTNLVFKAKARQSSLGVVPGNGLSETGAVIRLNGRVLIDESRFFAWAEAQRTGGGQ
jgi:hypothetical protein